LVDWIISRPDFEADQICPMNQVWPWNGHRLFAYDLVRFLRPRRIVELGTYWGTSFFSFCQAVKDHDLQTECIAVDTWEGDDDTGSYDIDVYETVEKISEQFFANVNIRLLKEYFDKARAYVDDASINILHIDGLHTYQAIKNDFETWLPKLSDNGIVLFHDIADSCDYGSADYWKEISEVFPSFSFQHSWGLGVLFPKGQIMFDLMKDQNIEDKLKIYEYHSRLLLSEKQISDLEKFNKQQDDLIKLQEKKLETLTREKDRIEIMLTRIQGSFAVKACKYLGLLSID
jgi:predicted O-methyltransferase YrrM